MGDQPWRPPDAAAPRVVVAFDALGAERGPAVVVSGVRTAAEEGIGVRVFGRRAELSELDGVDGVEVIESSELIGNDEEPVRAVRARASASVVMAADDVAAGNAQAFASPGSTGAVMAAALFSMKRIRGVQRPGLAVRLPVPGRQRPLLMLDVGANADARPSHLVQFAFLGAAFAESVLGIGEPRVALLSVGAEAKKGSQLVVEAHRTLVAASGIGFVGNVEGSDLLDPECPVDVVVTDGFTGNAVLKTIEGTAKAVAGAVRGAARSGPRAAVGGLLLKPALATLRQGLDPDQTGGAILLGVRGVAVVGHGSTGAVGVTNQLRLAARSVGERAVGRAEELLQRSGAGRGALRKGAADARGGDSAPRS